MNNSDNNVTTLEVLWRKGKKSNSLQLPVQLTDNVKDLRGKVSQIVNTPVQNLKMIFKNNVLLDGMKLVDAGFDIIEGQQVVVRNPTVKDLLEREQKKEREALTNLIKERENLLKERENELKESEKERHRLVIQNDMLFKQNHDLIAKVLKKLSESQRASPSPNSEASASSLSPLDIIPITAKERDEEAIKEFPYYLSKCKENELLDQSEIAEIDTLVCEVKKK